MPSLMGTKAVVMLAGLLALPLVAANRPPAAQFGRITDDRTCVVFEFRNLESFNAAWGRIAAQAVAAELGKTKRFDTIVSGEGVEEAAKAIGLANADESVLSQARVTQWLRAGFCVRGDVFGIRVEKARHGRRAVVGVRAVAYETGGGYPTFGGMAKGESAAREGVSDADLVSEAIRAAAVRATQKMPTLRLPSAKVLNVRLLTATIDQGSRGGFRIGDDVVHYQGKFALGTARVVKVTPDWAEIRSESDSRLAPGSRIVRLYSPPPLPLP